MHAHIEGLRLTVVLQAEGGGNPLDLLVWRLDRLGRRDDDGWHAGILHLRDHLGRAGCLLADYRLSISDGISVLETLRARGHETPAILMTAFGSDEVAGRARSAGFVEVLEKPFRDHVLMAALSRATAQPPVPL